MSNSLKAGDWVVPTFIHETDRQFQTLSKPHQIETFNRYKYSRSGQGLYVNFLDERPGEGPFWNSYEISPYTHSWIKKHPICELEMEDVG